VARVSTNIANILVNGTITGLIYALIGIGFVVIFRATGVISFAQGAFMMVGALLFASCVNRGIGIAGSLAIVCVVLFVIGGLVYWLVFSRLVGGEPFVVAVATVGLGILLEEGALLIWGPSIINIPVLFSIHLYHISGALALNSLDFFTIVLTLVVFAIVMFGLYRTPVGLQMRAVANNPRLATFAGVSVVRVSILAWAIAGLTASLAGVVYLLGAQPDAGSVYSLGLQAFPAILLGGIDSVAGALVGGLLIGLLQAAVATYIGGAWNDVVSYGVLLAILLLRPQGLFGNPAVARL
jgi:branched-chain amino acid transport system permease protein